MKTVTMHDLNLSRGTNAPQHLLGALTGTAHLVLEGRTFNLPHDQPRAALLELLIHLKPLVLALRDFIARGGTITFRLCEQDPLARNQDAWELLREIFPGLNRENAGAPVIGCM